MKFYQRVRSVKRSKLANFEDDIISIDWDKTLQIGGHDIKSLYLRQECGNRIETL